MMARQEAASTFGPHARVRATFPKGLSARWSKRSFTWSRRLPISIHRSSSTMFLLRFYPDLSRSVMLNTTTIDKFKAGLRGELIQRSDPHYEEARRLYNG